MSKYTDILGLDAEATEDQITGAVNKIIHDRNTGNSAARVSGSVAELKKIARSVGVDVPDNLATDEDARAELRIMIKQAYEAKATKAVIKKEELEEEQPDKTADEDIQTKQTQAIVRFMLKQRLSTDKKIKADCIEDALDKIDSKKIKITKGKDGEVADVIISDDAYTNLKGTRPSYFEAETGDKTRVGVDGEEVIKADAVEFANTQAAKVNFNN